MSRRDAEFVAFAHVGSRRLLRVAYLITNDAYQAEDAAQCAMVRTYAAWRGVRTQDAYGYARKVMINYLIDGWRRPLRERPTARIPERPSSVDLESEVIGRRWLVDALTALAPRERMVIVLRHLFDLPEADVAAELGISIGTVKSTNARALGKLRLAAA